MEKRYRVLRFISFIYKLLAILILIAAIGLAILTAVAMQGTSIPGLPVVPTAVAPGVESTDTPVDSLVPAVPGVPTGFPGMPVGVALPTSGIGLAISIFIGGLLWALGLYAIGDFISLFVAVEQNTRAGAEYNRQAALMMREVAKRLGGGTGNLGR